MSVDKIDRAFERQTSHNGDSDTYSTCCGVCGKAVSLKKRWFRSREKSLDYLRLNFNYCHSCGRLVCDDCFIVDDGNGTVAVCKECGEQC